MAIEDLEEILGDFKSNVKANRATMNEGTFMSVFKPVFEGRVGENSRLIEKYIELAGSEYSPVDLLDDNGDVVATVSGVLKPLPEDSRKDYKSIMHKFEHATSVLRINPIKAKAMEDGIQEEIEQGLLPSNAKSREYIVYHKEETKVAIDDDDLYNF